MEVKTMKKFLSFGLTLLLTSLTIFGGNTVAHAEEVQSPAQTFTQSNNKNINIPDTKSYKNVSITYVDPELVGTTKNSTAKNSLTNSINSTSATYQYSTLKFVSASLTQSHAKDLVNQTRITSVPYGKTVKLSSEVKISGSIEFKGNIGGKVKEVINLGLGLTVSGTFSYTYQKNEEFSFPANYIGKYNTAIYWSAIDHDEYLVCVGVTNHYSDGSTDYYESYYSGVLRPALAEYTTGVNY